MSHDDQSYYRRKSTTFGVLILGVCLSLLSIQFVWVERSVYHNEQTVALMKLSGNDVAQAFFALLFCALLITLTTLLAGKILRSFLSILGIVVGLCLILATVYGFLRLETTFLEYAAEHSLLLDPEILGDLQFQTKVAWWFLPFATVGSLLIVVGSFFMLLFHKEWRQTVPVKTVAFETADTEPDTVDSVDVWDALNQGEDPTQTKHE